MLVQRFEETVNKYSDRVAVKMNDETITYGELNRYADRIAVRISEESNEILTDGKDQIRVALLFGHGIHMIAGLLGVSKAGFTYVPLDRTYPINRLIDILQDSETSVILTDDENISLATEIHNTLLSIRIIQVSGSSLAFQHCYNTRLDPKTKSFCPAFFKKRAAGGMANAYILYTSGSTGKPRGVVQTYRNILYYAENWVRFFSINENDRMTFLTAFTHDGAEQDIWSALISGATLYPFDVKRMTDPKDLSEYILRERMTVWHSVPTLFRYFAGSLNEKKQFPFLRFILLGGEPLRKHDFYLTNTFFPSAFLANVYGQTESSVTSISIYRPGDTFSVPMLGKPLSETEILLVDDDGEIVDELGSGEVVVACPYLAPGYWRDDETTRKRFTEDPEMGMLYWTGDVGQLRGDGEIILTGRKDFQVKIRGFRVEPGEIETVLLQHEAINETAVIAKENSNGDYELCCYFVPIKANVLVEELRTYLSGRLPAYMVPAIFVEMEAFPLTVTGKVDRKALPEPGVIERVIRHVPLSTPIEEELAAIWSEELDTAYEHIGRTSNFFEMGGHSLKAINLISGVHKRFRVKLELDQIFAYPVLEQMAGLIESMKEGKAEAQFIAIEPVEKREYYPLSSAQKRLYFLNRLEPENTVYNLPNRVVLRERPDMERMRRVFKQLIQRHDSLRTSFIEVNDEPVQVIHDQVEFEIQHYELATEDTEVTEGEKKRVRREEDKKLSEIQSFIGGYFDLTKAPLLRVGLIKESDNQYLLMVNMHHIIADGVSLGIFSEEFQKLYMGESLPELGLQYNDYVRWQQRLLESRDGSFAVQDAYWVEQFADDVPVLELPVDYPRPEMQHFDGGTAFLSLDVEPVRRLKALAEERGVTLYMVLLAAVNILLSKLSGQEDIVIGTPVAGRNHADLKPIIGMFVNTLALRGFPCASKPFGLFLQEVKDTALNGFRNQDYPFEDLVEKIGLTRDMSRNPLFDVMFSLHNENDPLDRGTGFSHQGIHSNTDTENDTLSVYQASPAKFDLTFHVVENAGRVNFYLVYAAKLFKPETAERFLVYLEKIITQVSFHPDMLIHEIEIITENEREMILHQFNATDAPYPKDKTIHELFREQSKRTPDRIAVIGSGLQISYRELDQRSDQLAQELIQRGIKPDSIVAIKMNRSVDLMIGLFGILKSGGAYLPVDPSFPQERIDFMLKDSGAALVITDSESGAHAGAPLRDFSVGADPCVCPLIDHAKQEMGNESGAHAGAPLRDCSVEADPCVCPESGAYIDAPLRNSESISILDCLTLSSSQPLNFYPPPSVSSVTSVANSNLAYIIYTSGSTGRPKGVMIDHHSLVNRLHWMQKAYPLNAGDTLLQKTPLVFDVSLWELFWWIWGGSKLCLLVPGGEKDPNAIVDAIQKHRVTVIHFVPSMFHVFLEYLNELGATQKVSALTRVITSGEALTPALVEGFKRVLGSSGHTRLTNLYGPTEATVDVSYFDCPADTIRVVPIGKPIDNISLYILNKHNRLQPVGVSGECCIAGVGLARGYLNNPELTAEKFIGCRLPVAGCLNRTHHPNKNFCGGPGGGFYKKSPLFLYKTGDLARWMDDGNIEFLGRIDHQVKIRGFRIELGEITNRLLTVQGIREAVVLDRTDSSGEKYLCAYLVWRDEQQNIDVSELRHHLSGTLPEYMIPSFFVNLKQLPLTVSGKIDRNALPEPAAKSMNRLNRCTMPRNEIEKGLALIWSELLNIDRKTVDIDTNFFAIGGHSLKATMLANRIHKTFNVKMSLAEIFKNPTIRGLSRYISEAPQDTFTGLVHAPRQEHYALSPAQKRIYLLQMMDEESTGYNISTSRILKEHVDTERIESIFSQLIRRHESLRTSFTIVDNEPVQIIHEHVEFKINVFAPLFSKSGPPEAFHLSEAPLLRVGLINIDEQTHLLMLDLHHIITDGFSNEILAREFERLSAGEELPPLVFQYKDYAYWQNRRVLTADIKKQGLYWKERMFGEIPVLDLPADYPRPALQSFEGGRVHFILGENETRKLNELASTRDITNFMVLLSVFVVFLSKLSGQTDVIVGTPVSGREHEDFRNIIGVFINTLALRKSVDVEQPFSLFIDDVKTRTLEAFENREYPFEELVESLSLQRDISRSPLFDVMFLYEAEDAPNNNRAFPRVIHDEADEYSFETGTSPFDLTLTVEEAFEETGEKLRCNFQYASRLFKKETVQRFVRYFETLVHSILANSDEPICRLTILPEAERSLILNHFNAASVDFASEKTVGQLFEDQVKKTPDHIAVIGSTSRITYRVLDERSDRLAGALIEKGVGPDVIVAIKLERSIDMMIGILGIWKAGGAYLPIDPSLPSERIDYMLKDSGAKLLLATEVTEDTEVRDSGSSLALQHCCVGADPCVCPSIDYSEPGMCVESGAHTGAPLRNSESISSPSVYSVTSVAKNSNLAYAIYTSGSTGLPKGILIPHRSVVNFIKGITDVIPFREKDVILSLTTISFDIFGLETILPLTCGSRVIIGTKDEQVNAGLAAQVMVKENVTLFQATPSRLQLFIMDSSAVFSLRRLSYLLVGGEAFPQVLRDQLRKLTDGTIVNMYGPTETTIWSLISDVSDNSLITIGKPIANTRVYIMNRFNTIQPIGIAGELCIGGEGLARGYLNNPELTSEKFKDCLRRAGALFEKTAPAPRKNFWYGRLYKTGDLARWLEDGNIEFLGRIDHQVKIRGFRIELGEIENRLLKSEMVQDVAVIDRADHRGEKFLCAYLVLHGEYGNDWVSELRQDLSTSLPEYMIPSYFIKLEKMPLTVSGKIDRKSLPVPGGISGGEYTAPRDSIEKKLAQIWTDLLMVSNAETVGIDSNFFQSGGHSLKAAQMSARIQSELNIRTPMAVIFKNPTIRGLAAFIRELKKQAVSGAPIVQPAEEKEYYPLSAAQKRLYILNRMNPESTAYHMTSMYELGIDIEYQKIEDIFKQLIRRHDSLRTSFHMIEGEPVQRIHHEVELTKVFAGVQGAVFSKRAPWSPKAFDLSQAPLLQVYLINIESSKNLLIVDMHHIISDGMSVGILIHEFITLLTGEELVELPIRYKDYAEWENSSQGRTFLFNQERYWLEEFQGEVPVLRLPVDFQRPVVPSDEGGAFEFRLGVEEAKNVHALCLKEEASVFMLILAVFNILLSKLSGIEDIVVGVPSANRNQDELHRVMGMFVNTLALRNYPVGEKAFIDFLRELRGRVLEAFDHASYPFDALVENVVGNVEPGRNPLFDVMLAMEAIDVPKVENPSSTVELLPVESRRTTALFDIVLEVAEEDDTIRLVFKYRTQLFKDETARRFIGYFQRIISYVLENPDDRIADIDFISPEEKEQLVVAFNHTGSGYSSDQTIHELFEQQVQRTPDHIAVLDQGTRDAISFLKNRPLDPQKTFYYLTYRELNKISNHFASELRQRGVESGIVGIRIERSIDMIIGVLGILKAGAAYLPIDGDYPQERIDYMLRDSGALLLLATEEFIEVKKLRSWEDTKEIFFDHLNLSSSQPLNFLFSKPATGNRQPASSLAYVIYTSGSTGKPKGVMIEHRNVTRLVMNPNFMDWHDGQRLLMTGSLVFDISTFEIFGPLLNGLTLVVVNKDTIMDPARLRETIIKSHISILHLIPQLFSRIMDEQPTCFETLDYFLIGGDSVNPVMVNRLRSMYPSLTIVHCYGPTENTTFSTTLRVQEDYTERIPIGLPIGQSSAYIVDPTNRLAPIGVVGEICVGGEGVARGYLNNPELTFDKFIHLSQTKSFCGAFFKKRPAGGIIYKTGDLGRRLSDGNIEFLGRIDHQVKIRGIRIEPGEIENGLLRHSRIKDAVVVSRNQDLCAYIVPKEPVSIDELRAFLLDRLPAVMVPSLFVFLEKVPLNLNGKIDRNALPDPFADQQRQQRHQRRKEDQTSLTPVEEKLKQILEKLLNVENLCLSDDFFQMGGNSLKIVSLISEIYKAFKVEIPMNRLLRNPRVKDIAQLVVRNKFESEREEIGVRLTTRKNHDRMIFCFPPAIGYGISYMDLALLLDEYSLYAFNYIDDANIMERYLETIERLQPQGPTTLLGYSAGGNLCMKAAEELEKAGHTVSDIIILDAYKQRKQLDPNVLEKLDREFREDLIRSIENLGLEPFKEKIMAKLDRYLDYYNQMEFRTVLQADIHLIRAEDKKGDAAFIGWKDVTCGQYMEYEGAGMHRDMLAPGYIDLNARLIKQLLNPAIRLTSETRDVHAFFSSVDLKFREHVIDVPELLQLTSYSALNRDRHVEELHPWPVFINHETRNIIAEVSERVCRLVKSVPRRLFGDDIHAMSAYYGVPASMIETQLNGVTPDMIDNLLARGDFILTGEEVKRFKCIEFNIAGNIGGLDIPTWEARYLQVPIIREFLTKHRITIHNQNLVSLLFTHMTNGMTVDAPVIAVVLPGYTPGEFPLETYACDVYRELIPHQKHRTENPVVFCDYSHLNVRQNALYFKNQKIDVLLETYGGVVPPQIMTLFREGRIRLFNGPVTGLLSSKLNIALLSENEDSPVFSSEEREIIKNHIPWTRKIVQAETMYNGKAVNLIEWILTNRERFVIKAPSEFGGKDVYAGKAVSASEWEAIVSLALKQGKWLVQAYQESVPYVSMTGDRQSEPHDIIWGFYVFGGTYSGGLGRLIPRSKSRGVVNVMTGAKLTVLFEVDG
ncbi:MAG: amino acid adenylation domain-containing protein [Candidatus Omnitrophota bacterium]